ALGPGDFVVRLDRNGCRARSDANLNAVEDTLFVLSAAVELDDDSVVIERDIGHRHDLSGFDRLSVFLDFSLQFVLVDLTGFRELDAVVSKRQADTGRGLIRQNRPENVIPRIARDLGQARGGKSQVANAQKYPKNSVRH